MKYSYSKTIQELKDHALIPVGDIYEFESARIAPIYERYYQFCQENLEEKSNEYNIQPSRFYFRNKFGINAQAGYQNGIYIVGVNMSTIDSLYSLLHERNDIFEVDKCLSELYGSLISEFDVPVGHLMFQLSTLFIFYHEKAHLGQFSGESHEWLTEVLKTEYSAERHALELDADIDAAHFICFHLLEYFKKLSPQERTSENLEKTLSIGIASIFSYFLIYFERSGDIYFNEHSHPHTLVRISYILDCMIRVAEHNLPDDITINSVKVLNESFKITDQYYKRVNDSDLVKDFINQFKIEANKITDYVNTLLEFSKRMPNLIKNRFSLPPIKG
jgi:hypothetical protein